MMMYFTYTGRESKEVYARNELVVMIGLMAPPVGTSLPSTYATSVHNDLRRSFG
jgi:hypothetical protein